MTDELERLRAGLKAPPPAADPAAKAAALARAMEAFDGHQAGRPQETAADRRPMSDRPEGAGFLTGVRTMLSNLTTRQTLAATASVAAICVALIVVGPALQRDAGPVSLPDTTPTVEPAKPEQMLQEETVAQPLEKAAVADELSETATIAEGGGTAPAASEPVMDAEIAPEARLRREQAPGSAAIELDGSAAQGTLYGAEPQGFAVGQIAPAPADVVALPQPNTEAFPEADQNPVKIAVEEPVSTFSIDVDTAAYTVVRSSLMAGYLPPADAVRIEEMVNYFPYAYPAPEAGGAPFRPAVSLAATPWNPDTRLLRIGIQGRQPATEARPALNLVFLIDTSGSMEDPNKLPLLKQSFRLMLGELRPEDQVAIVTYAGSAGQVLAPTPASDTAAVARGRAGAVRGTAGPDGQTTGSLCGARPGPRRPPG